MAGEATYPGLSSTASIPDTSNLTREGEVATTQRRRVGRACDYCKRKRIRCTGDRPCQHCMAEGITCEYKAPYHRGQRRKKHLQPTNPTVSPTVSPENRARSATRVVDTTTAHDESILTRDSSGACQGGGQGPFVGASSSLNFLSRLQRRLRSQTRASKNASSTVLTRGDAILPEFDEERFDPPPREKAEELSRIYFELISPTYKFLHRPTVESWIQQLYDHGRILEDHANSKYAVVLMVFARASRYPYRMSDESGLGTGVEYFQASERYSSREVAPATLSSVQALLGCSLWVLSNQRFNHCWTLFGTVTRLLLALGLNRRKAVSDASHSDLVQEECGKRVFWCAYVLDKYLSSMFGRPCALHDDDIDQDMPTVIEDTDISATAINTTGTNKMNSMMAPLYHQKLGQILSQTLRRLYGIQPLEHSALLEITAELGREVDRWREDLPAFLNQEKVDSWNLVGPFRDQSDILNLAVRHLEILIFRPCLLNNIHSPTAERSRSNMNRCIRAAMGIVDIITRMIDSNRLPAASWLPNHTAFCAVVVLYTCATLDRHDDPSTWLGNYRAAENCQKRIAAVAGTDPLARRYLIIMEEFRLEVAKQIQHDSSSPNAVFEQEPDEVDHLFGCYDTDESPWMDDSSNQIANFLDMPNWEQLGSLALDLSDVLPNLGSVL